jgi:hypothetical protein
LSSLSGASACFSSYIARKFSRAFASATGSPDDTISSESGPNNWRSVFASPLRAAAMSADTASSGEAKDV